MNFFVHSLNRLVLKKKKKKNKLQIYPLNACKIDWEENLYDFNVESIDFKIKILINITNFDLIINDIRLYNSNTRIGAYLDQTQAIKCQKRLVKRLIYAYNLLNFCVCVGACTCNNTPLLRRPALHNPTLFCSCIMGLTLLRINVLTSSQISAPSWHPTGTSKSSPFFLIQGSSWNSNVFLAFIIIFKSLSDIMCMDFAKSMLLFNNSGDTGG